MQDSVSVVGLGLMGRPMARVLMAGGWQVRGWNRTALPAEWTDGIPLCQSLAEAAESAVILLMLADTRAVEEVLARLNTDLSAGQLVLDMGSSDPTQSQAHAQRLAARGIGWVDAPVSGGPEGAAAGTLAVMAGGNEAEFERVRPILETLGGNVVRVGPAGAGHTVKVINQLIVGLMIEAVAEGLTLAEKAGVDAGLVQAALKGGLADSKILQIHGDRMRRHQYSPGAKVISQLKDLRMAEVMAASLSIELPHLLSAILRYETLAASGYGDLDHSALHKLFWTA